MPGAEADPFKGLRKGHPRLILTDPELERLKAGVRSSPEVAQAWERLRAQAEKILTQEPVKYEIPDGLRLLSTSKKCLEREYVLGLAWRMTGEGRFAERAFRELEAAAGFPDWNPRHFLDTGEMSHAFGIGYDWLYGYLTPERRKLVREALVRMGIRPYLKGCEEGAWWARAHNNWGQVCHGGSGVAALAMAEEEPELSRRVVAGVLAGLPVSMKPYAPDGGMPEGPGYWHYATQYAVFLFAALETAGVGDGGLPDSPGFGRTGYFRIHSSGPAGRTFNYADAGEKAGRGDEMFWLARRYGVPAFAGAELERTPERTVEGLVWGREYIGNPGGAREAAGNIPLDARFTGVNVAFMRSAWNDPDAVYVGFKGGDNKASHGHLDLGSFVLDALGERWAADLGSDNYNMPGYFGNKRWTYYRLKTESHNTVTLGGKNQDPKAEAPLTAFLSTPERAHAVADLTAAYSPGAASAFRGVALLNRRRVLVQDEFELVKPERVVWALFTRAEVTADGRRAELESGGKTVCAEILEPAGAVFSCDQTKVAPPEAPNDGVTRLGIILDRPAGPVRVAVLLTPGAGSGGAPPALTPLAEWGGKGSE
jgi:hypothetical protein